MKLELKGDKLYVYRMTHIQIEAYGVGNIRYFVPIELLFNTNDKSPNFTLTFQNKKQNKNEYHLVTEKSILTHKCHGIYLKDNYDNLLGYDCAIKIHNITNTEILYQPEECLGYYEL